MSSIFKAAGDVVDSAVDVVTDNKEILAAIALAYATGGASIPAEATAATTAELTALEIAEAEAAAAAAAQATAAQKAQLEAAKLAAYNSGEVALSGNAFVPNTMTAQQAYPSLTGQVANNSMVLNTGTTADVLYPDLTGQVSSTSQVVNQGAKDPTFFEKLQTAGGNFVNDPFGSVARGFEEYRPKTPGEYFTTALTMSAGGNVISALNQPKQEQVKRSTTNTYTGEQAPKTYVTQPATLPLPTRYDTAKQQVSKTVGTPTNIGLLAVNNSPFYDFLKTNNLNRGIL